MCRTVNLGSILQIFLCLSLPYTNTVHTIYMTHTMRKLKIYEPRYEKNRLFAYAKTKTQISFAVTAKLISAFVFTIRIVQSLYFLYPEFQVSSHLLWRYSPVCVGPGQKPRRPVFSQRGSYMLCFCQGKTQANLHSYRS